MLSEKKCVPHLIFKNVRTKPFFSFNPHATIIFSFISALFFPPSFPSPFCSSLREPFDNLSLSSLKSKTGSGKTHTMGGVFTGARDQNAAQGIYALASADVFRLNQSADYKPLNLNVSVSFFEIYGGKVHASVYIYIYIHIYVCVFVSEG